MYDRLFTFGCSFTSWHYPTWADILGQDFNDKYRNLGMCAAGNEFIFHRLIEAHAREKITKNDLVIVCWTNFAREDRYLQNKGWATAGNIFTQDLYDKEWVKKWFDLRGALIKTSGFIASATEVLERIGCKYLFISMMPMSQLDEYKKIFVGEEFNDVFNCYAQYYSKIKPSITETLWGRGEFSSKNPVKFYFTEGGNLIKDNHPSPNEHMMYLNKVVLKEINMELSQRAINWTLEWEDKVRTGNYISEWPMSYRINKFHGNYFQVS